MEEIRKFSGQTSPPTVVNTFIILWEAIYLDYGTKLRTFCIGPVIVNCHLHVWERLAPARQPFHSKKFVNDCHIIVWARAARTLLQDPTFAQLQYHGHQIFYVFVFARDQLHISTSIGGLERAFACSRATVQRALRSGWDAPKPRGRHTALSADAEADILGWIRKNYEKSNPVTRTEIRHYCETKYTVPITCGWVDSFFAIKVN
jgi:hypothetical protein